MRTWNARECLRKRRKDVFKSSLIPKSIELADASARAARGLARSAYSLLAGSIVVVFFLDAGGHQGWNFVDDEDPRGQNAQT
ncbi:hypothetical protein QQS21_011665 [Conoideocrella luteorostrata]|uniref:Uncharacterized protein n=1 Tax=Conoideocrella luteorostrata TaxID=1105319 RepID=A0AAJ0FNC9_9HYPO|nr:hypothetical protein QQS21_011665 [Conoideocrella luteorostrata]